MHNIEQQVIEEFMIQVRIASPSLHEAAFFEYLKKRLKDFPVEMTFYPFELSEIGLKSGNLVVKLPANEAGHRTLFFDGHVDTVQPGVGIEPVLQNGMVRSSGDTILGSDDKAATASMVIALENLVKSNVEHGNVYFLFTAAEEIGLIGVNHLDLQTVQADYGFVLDSHGSVGGVVLAAPYHYTYEITIHGHSTHAGIEPEKGLNAILLMGQLMQELPAGRLDEESTANIGMIEGGKATNIVPDECRMRGEFRSLKKERVEVLKKQVQEVVERFKPRSKGIDLHIKEEYQGFETAENEPIVQLVDRAIREIGNTVRHENTGGGSNTNVYNQRGNRALTLAIGMTDVHSVKESIQTKDLRDVVRLILKLVEMA